MPNILYACIFFNKDLNVFVCYYNISIMTCVKSNSLEDCLNIIKKELYNYNIYNQKNIKLTDISLSYMIKTENKTDWKMQEYGNLNKLYNLVF